MTDRDKCTNPPMGDVCYHSVQSWTAKIAGPYSECRVMYCADCDSEIVESRFDGRWRKKTSEGRAAAVNEDDEKGAGATAAAGMPDPSLTPSRQPGASEEAGTLDPERLASGAAFAQGTRQPTPSASPHEDLAAYHRLADRLYVLGGDVSSEELYDAIHWLADHLEASRDLLKQERERMGQESPLTDAQYAMKEREAEADDALHLLNATRAILGCTEPMSTLVADAECVRQLAINYRGALSRLVEASDRDLPTRREEARGVLAGQPYDPVEECTEHGSTAVLDGTGLAAVDSIVVGGRKFVPAQPPSNALPEAVRRWLGQNLPDADYMRGTTEREEIVAWRARVLGADVRPSAKETPASGTAMFAVGERVLVEIEATVYRDDGPSLHIDSSWGNGSVPKTRVKRMADVFPPHEPCDHPQGKDKP